MPPGSPPPYLLPRRLRHELGIFTTVKGATGMHPGPVVLPIVVVPGAELTSTLRWISGDVFDHSVCLVPTQLAVAVGDTTIHTIFNGHICGPDAAHVTVTLTRLAPDPTYKP